MQDARTLQFADYLHTRRGVRHAQSSFAAELPASELPGTMHMQASIRL